MSENRLLKGSKSTWGSPIVAVPKSDGSIRIYIDYRSLNSMTPQIQFLIPHPDDLVAKLGKAKFLFKLVLVKDYYQIQLSQSSHDLTSFVTPWKNFRFKVMLL